MKGTAHHATRFLEGRRGVLILLSSGALLLFMGIMWGLPNHWDFAQDSVVPLGQLARIRASAFEVTQYRYPPLHLHLLDIIFVPLRWFVEHSRIGENPKATATLFVLVARLVSVAMALGTISMIWRIGERLWNRRVGMLAAALFLLSPVTLYYGKNANLDVPYVFWLSLTLMFYVRLLQHESLFDCVGLGLTAAMAVCTKDQAYAFLVLMPIPILLRLWRRPMRCGEDHARSTARRWLWPTSGLVVFVIVFVLIHGIPFDPARFVRHIRTIVGPASEGWRECTIGPAGQARLLALTLLRLFDAWTPAGVILATMGIAIAVRDDSEEARTRRALLIPVASYYLFFPAVVGYIYARFALPLLLVFSLFAGDAADRLLAGSGRRGLRCAGVALIGWVALAGLSVNWVMTHYSRYDAQRWLESEYPGGATLAYVGDMRDMPRFNEPLEAVPLVGEGEDLSLDDALRSKRPTLLVVSLEAGDPATSGASWRVAGILRRALSRTTFGRHTVSDPEREARARFITDLLAGRSGYRVVRRFRSSIAPFVPEVAESLNRTIVILERV